MRRFTDEHLTNLSKGQHTRKLNSNSATGHKNISPHKSGGYEVKVGGSYIGYRKSLKAAIELRNGARCRLLEFAKEKER